MFKIWWMFNYFGYVYVLNVNIGYMGCIEGKVKNLMYDCVILFVLLVWRCFVFLKRK